MLIRDGFRFVMAFSVPPSFSCSSCGGRLVGRLVRLLVGRLVLFSLRFVGRSTWAFRSGCEGWRLVIASRLGRLVGSVSFRGRLAFLRLCLVGGLVRLAVSSWGVASLVMLARCVVSSGCCSGIVICLIRVGSLRGRRLGRSVIVVAWMWRDFCGGRGCSPYFVSSGRGGVVVSGDVSIVCPYGGQLGCLVLVVCLGVSLVVLSWRRAGRGCGSCLRGVAVFIRLGGGVVIDGWCHWGDGGMGTWAMR